MDASILNYTVNDNVGEFLSNDKKLYINGSGLKHHQVKHLM